MSAATEGTPEFYEKGDILPCLYVAPSGSTRWAIPWIKREQVISEKPDSSVEFETAIAARVVGTDSWDHRVRKGTAKCFRSDDRRWSVNVSPRTPAADRFYRYVVVNEVTGCHEWTGCRVHGYGQIREYGKNIYAHRLALEMAGIEVPLGVPVLHRCDNPSCVRPDHLYLGTPADNNADMAKRDRGRKGSLPYGVKINVQNGRSYITARFTHRTHPKHLGSYKTIEAAAAVAKHYKDLFYGLIPPEPEDPYEGAQWDDYAQ